MEMRDAHLEGPRTDCPHFGCDTHQKSSCLRCRQHHDRAQTDLIFGPILGSAGGGTNGAVSGDGFSCAMGVCNGAGSVESQMPKKQKGVHFTACPVPTSPSRTTFRLTSKGQVREGKTTDTASLAQCLAVILSDAFNGLSATTRASGKKPSAKV